MDSDLYNSSSFECDEEEFENIYKRLDETPYEVVSLFDSQNFDRPDKINSTNRSWSNLHKPVLSDARACDRLAKDNWKLVTFLTNNVNWQIWDGSNSASDGWHKDSKDGVAGTDSNHLTAWYTDCENDPSLKLFYEYQGNVPQIPNQMPPWLKKMRDQMMTKLGLDHLQPPNSCNWNLYKVGNVGIAAHRDNEYLFDGLNRPVTIIGMSIGEERNFKIGFKEKHDVNVEMQEIKTALMSKLSYCTMEGWYQRDFYHAVPVEMEKVNPRINVTWRTIVVKEKPPGIDF